MDLASSAPSSPESPKRHRRTWVAVIAALVGLLLAGPLCVLDAAINGTSPKNLLSLEQQNFETGRDGWTGTDYTSTTTSSTIAYNGSRAYRIQANATRPGATLAPAVATTRRTTRGVRVTAGTSYDGSIRVHAGVTPRAARCELRWWKADGTELGTSPGAPVTASPDRWTQARCTARAPSGAATVALRVVFPTTARNEVHYADDAWLSVTPSAVTPPPATPTRSFAARINVAAGSDLVAPDGTRFTADSGYVGGTVGGPFGSTIAGTDNDALYAKHRFGMSGYSIPVPASGTYTVRLHFAETWFTTRGQRVFDVSAEGTIRQNDLDIVAAGGANTAVVRQFDVAVSDGKLDLGFTAVVENPMISGIEVLGGSGATTAATTTTAPPTTTTAPPTTTTPAAPTTTTTPPSTGGFPNASNTGVPAGTSLTSSGSITTTANGQVIDARNVSGQITVNHSNVTIRRTRVVGSGIFIDPSTSGTVIEDCELDGSPMSGANAAVAFARFTIRRCNIHHFGEGISANGDAVIEGNYIHSFRNFMAQGAHQDGIQMEYGSNIRVRNNTIVIGVDGANAAIWLSAGEPHSNVVIENNLVAGGSFAIGAGNQATVRNNRISRQFWPNGGWYGAFTYRSGSAVVTGNVWHETGQAIP